MLGTVRKNILVVPAEAGTQRLLRGEIALGPRFRGDHEASYCISRIFCTSAAEIAEACAPKRPVT